MCLRHWLLQGVGGCPVHGVLDCQIHQVSVGCVVRRAFHEMLKDKCYILKGKGIRTGFIALCL